MQIIDEIKVRGVEDILFISMDRVSGLEEGAKSIFKDVVVQRCIVHLIRNSIKYISSKDIWKQLMYGYITGPMWNSSLITEVPCVK